MMGDKLFQLDLHFNVDIITKLKYCTTGVPYDYCSSYYNGKVKSICLNYVF